MINENHGTPQKELPERLGISWNVSALVRAMEKKGLIGRTVPFYLFDHLIPRPNFKCFLCQVFRTLFYRLYIPISGPTF